MWKILSNHTTRNLSIQATIMSSHVTVKKKKKDCPLEGKCRTENIIYEFIVSTSGHPDKVYFGTAEGDFKKIYCNHISSFKNETQMNKTTLAKYFWEQKQRHNITPTLKWYIVKSVASYSNITKRCMLSLHEKTNPNQDELLNKRSKLVSKCCHINKYLLSNYKAND